jgi:hypothetical protein
MNGQTQNKQHSINNKQVKNEKKKNCHEDTKTLRHYPEYFRDKEHTINIINFVNSLSLWVFVAKITFRRGLNNETMKKYNTETLK